MNTRKREVRFEAIEGAEPGAGYAVEVTFQSGGMNYMNYQQEERGFYLLVRREVRMADGCRTFGMFDGRKALLLPAARFSAKALREIKFPEELVGQLKVAIEADRVMVAERRAERAAEGVKS